MSVARDARAPAASPGVVEGLSLVVGLSATPLAPGAQHRLGPSPCQPFDESAWDIPRGEWALR